MASSHRNLASKYAYAERHTEIIELSLTDAVDLALEQQSDDPIAAIIDNLQAQRRANAADPMDRVVARARSAVATAPAEQAGWTAAGWLSSLRTDALVAGALLAPLGGSSGGGLELTFVRALASECSSSDDVLRLLREGPLLASLAAEI